MITFDASGAPIPEGFEEAQANAAAQRNDVGYFQGKVAEFQQMMNDLDSTAAGLTQLIQTTGIDDQVLNDKLAEFDKRKFAFRAAAETLNFAVSSLNSFGANLPLVNIPQGLAAVPVAALAAVAGAVAVAAALITWGHEWIRGVNQRLQTQQLLNKLPPDQQAKAAQQILDIEATAKANEVSPLASLASVMKWVAIGAGIYFVFRAFDSAQH